MKIIYLHQYFCTPEMPGGTRSYEMAKRLVANGHEVHIITAWRDEVDQDDWFLEEIDGIKVHWLPVRYSNNMSYPQRIKAFMRFAFKSGGRAISVGGDVVFATSTPLTIAIPGVRAARKLKVPMVFEVRDLWPELPIAMGALNNPVSIYIARKLESFAYRNSHSIIALSSGMAEGVVRAGFPSAKVSIIPNSCDVDLFSPNPKVTDRDFFSSLLGKTRSKVVLYPGTLGHINDVGYLVDVAYAVKDIDESIDFVVIGSGVQREKIIDLASEKGVLGKNFHVFESIPKRDLVAAFHSADLISSLFLPIKEMEPNSANKFFDALASATPIMINYGGWQKEIIRQHRCGIDLDRDIERSAKRLVEYLSDEEGLKRDSANAFHLAQGQFNRDVLAKDFEKVLVDAACIRKGGGNP